MDEDEDYAIGLDLGTTFSCIGVYKDGKVEIIPNSKGEKTTPSIVILTNDSNIYVGEDAIDYLDQYYDCCISEIKRLIGRKLSDKNIKEEIKKLPYKIISNSDESLKIQININGILVYYNPVEISAFIIKKMIRNAEKYLNKQITKLVITVPAYFNDSQRKLTKQAAEIVGLKVLRVINEPTAAALAYGFNENKNINENILVFDLGGGTFDVSILSVKKDENNPNYKSFQVLGASGDTQLGGKDFDNQLVEYFLNKMYKKEEIMQNKQLINQLKIACERIKRILSDKDKATLHINEFYEKMDVIENITRDEFENICEPLFKKIIITLEDSLRNAKLTKNDIQEIILIGGSTRIPKIKEIVKNYFPKSHINCSINPDEAVAFGATIEAEKLINNKNKAISNFILLDAIPLSLGTNTKNKYKETKIKNEGDLMSVIIKRGTFFPVSFSKTYGTIVDNQKTMTIDIYEGENNFVKYNHLLKKSEISGLTPRPKGQTKVVVTFDINIDGILSVKAEEESKDNNGKKLFLSIINDEISLNDETIKELEQKNKELMDKLNRKDLSGEKDYTNLRGILKTYNDAYQKCKENNENDDGAIYKINFNNALEKFIDLFDKSFDNETLFEKVFLYIKELFTSYIETFTLELEKEDKKNMVIKIKEYISLFIDKSTDYLNDLIRLLSGILKIEKKKIQIIFYDIIIYVIEKLNEIGIEYIFSEKKFCKYYSLNYFESAKTYYEKYLSNVDEAILPQEEINKFNKQKKTFEQYIKDINSGAIVLCLASFNGGYIFDDLLQSKDRGLTREMRKLLPKSMNTAEELERYKLILSNYEKILSSIQSSNEYRENTKKEAICIANIIKINKILGMAEKKGKFLLKYAKRCMFIIENQKDQSFKSDKWYLEFIKLYEEISNYECNKEKDEDYLTLFGEVKSNTNNQEIFNKIDEKFNCKKKEIDFINYILKYHPYDGYMNDKSTKGEDYFNNYNLVLVNYLLEKYQPCNFPRQEDEEEERLNFCISHEIFSKLSNLYSKIQ